MSLKLRIGLLTLLPLLLVTIAIGVGGLLLSRWLAAEQAELVREQLLAARQGELERLLDLAVSLVGPVAADARLDDAAALAEMHGILHALRFEPDGYFFMYDRAAVNLVHSTQPEIEGSDLWDARDSRGCQVIPALWAVVGQPAPPLSAQAPGPGCERVAALRDSGAGTGKRGFLRYRWQRPSTAREADKMGLVTRLDARDWLLGTGLYYDDIEQGVAAAHAQVVASINRAVLLTLSGLAAVTLAAAVLVGLGTWQQGRLASRRLQALAHRFVTLQVEERRGFARDLHDGLSQPLAGIAYHLDAACGSDRGEADGAPDPWRQARAALEQAMAEVRRIGEGLRPALLDDRGLKAALAALLADYALRTGWATRFECTLAGHDLGENLEITLYRVAQEALTNAERHANASQVGLAVAICGAQVVMSVDDDGRGLPDRARAAAPAGGRGHGLRNMRERVELLGGSFDIASGPGTRVSAALPLPTTGEEAT